MQGKKSLIWIANRSPKVSSFRPRPWCKIPSLYLWRSKSFNKEMKHYQKKYLEYRTISIPIQLTKMEKTSIEKDSTKKILLIRTLTGEMKPVVTRDKWVLVWITRKVIGRRFFWKSQTITILVQWTKWTVCQLLTPLEVLRFRLSSWWRKSSFQWLRNTTLNMERIEWKKHFMDPECQDFDAKNTNRQFCHRKVLYI